MMNGKTIAQKLLDILEENPVEYDNVYKGRVQRGAAGNSKFFDNVRNATKQITGMNYKGAIGQNSGPVDFHDRLDHQLSQQTGRQDMDRRQAQQPVVMNQRAGTERRGAEDTVAAQLLASQQGDIGSTGAQGNREAFEMIVNNIHQFVQSGYLSHEQGIALLKQANAIAGSGDPAETKEQAWKTLASSVQSAAVGT